MSTIQFLPGDTVILKDLDDPSANGAEAVLVEREPRRKLCRFVTGSSRRPNGGVADFRIGPKEGGDGAFPFAHACANALDMPSYSSMAVLRERLEAAVEAAHDKFTDL